MLFSFCKNKTYATFLVIKQIGLLTCYTKLKKTEVYYSSLIIFFTEFLFK
jgi:hypothetical protein